MNIVYYADILRYSGKIHKMWETKAKTLKTFMTIVASGSWKI